MQSLGSTSVALFVPVGPVLLPIARQGKSEGVWDGADRIELDAPLAVAEAFRTGHTVWIPTREEWRRRYADAPPAYHQQTGSVLAVPLVTEGETVLGVLGLLFRREHAMQREERQLATTMGQHAAQAFERARLFESERELADRALRLQVAAAFAARRPRPRSPTSWWGWGPASCRHVPRRSASWIRRARSSSCGARARRSARRGRCIELGIGWPGDDAIASRGVVWIRDVEDARRRYPRAIDEGALDPTVWLTLPLLNESGAIGFAHLAFEPPGPGEELQGALATLVSQASQAMDRARLFGQEQEVASVLQRSLLPRDLTQTPAFTVAARYQPGAEHLEVGGDWYEVISLTPHRLAIAIGDVVGRGLEAAAAMGQLRSALRALALQDLGPAAVIDGLEAFAERTPNAAMSTVVYGELDADTGEFRYCIAGHRHRSWRPAGRSTSSRTDARRCSRRARPASARRRASPRRRRHAGALYRRSRRAARRTDRPRHPAARPGAGRDGRARPGDPRRRDRPAHAGRHRAG
jgi:serine/threonine-protein kinase RsbW